MEWRGQEDFGNERHAINMSRVRRRAASTVPEWLKPPRPGRISATSVERPTAAMFVGRLEMPAPVLVELYACAHDGMVP